MVIPDCGEAEPAIYCSKCERELEEDERSSCQHKGCKHDALCIGCAFECYECDARFCAEHVYVTDGPGRFSLFLCFACYDARREATAIQKEVA